MALRHLDRQRSPSHSICDRSITTLDHAGSRDGPVAEAPNEGCGSGLAVDPGLRLYDRRIMLSTTDCRREFVLARSHVQASGSIHLNTDKFAVTFFTNIPGYFGG